MLGTNSPTETSSRELFLFTGNLVTTLAKCFSYFTRGPKFVIHLHICHRVLERNGVLLHEWKIDFKVWRLAVDVIVVAVAVVVVDIVIIAAVDGLEFESCIFQSNVRKLLQDVNFSPMDLQCRLLKTIALNICKDPKKALVSKILTSILIVRYIVPFFAFGTLVSAEKLLSVP